MNRTQSLFGMLMKLKWSPSLKYTQILLHSPELWNEQSYLDLVLPKEKIVAFYLCWALKTYFGCKVKYVNNTLALESDVVFFWFWVKSIYSVVVRKNNYGFGTEFCCVPMVLSFVCNNASAFSSVKLRHIYVHRRSENLTKFFLSSRI